MYIIYCKQILVILIKVDFNLRIYMREESMQAILEICELYNL